MKNDNPGYRLIDRSDIWFMVTGPLKVHGSLKGPCFHVKVIWLTYCWAFFLRLNIDDIIKTMPTCRIVHGVITPQAVTVISFMFVFLQTLPLHI